MKVYSCPVFGSKVGTGYLDVPIDQGIIDCTMPLQCNCSYCSCFNNNKILIFFFCNFCIIFFVNFLKFLNIILKCCNKNIVKGMRNIIV